MKDDLRWRDTQLENERLATLTRLLEGRYVLSTMPRLAIASQAPPVTEAHLLTHLERLGKFDFARLTNQVKSERFDAVVTARWATSWRGVDHVSSSLRRAITESYVPGCAYDKYLFHFPRSSRQSAVDLSSKLQQFGCIPPKSPTDPAISGW
jgi:hypothetical protein